MILICTTVSGETELTEKKGEKKVINNFSQREPENSRSAVSNALNRNLLLFWIYSLLPKHQCLIRSVCVEFFGRGFGVKLRQKCFLVLGGFGRDCFLVLIPPPQKKR